MGSQVPTLQKLTTVQKKKLAPCFSSTCLESSPSSSWLALPSSLWWQPTLWRRGRLQSLTPPRQGRWLTQPSQLLCPSRSCSAPGSQWPPFSHLCLESIQRDEEIF